MQRVVGAETDEVGHLEGEGRAASAVLARMPAIDEEVGDGFGAVAADEEPPALPGGGHPDFTDVIGLRAQKIAVVGARVGIPRVGQGDDPCVVAAVLRAEAEVPSAVERVGFAPARGRLGGRQRMQRQCGEDNQEDAFHR